MKGLDVRIEWGSYIDECSYRQYQQYQRGMDGRVYPSVKKCTHAHVDEDGKYAHWGIDKCSYWRYQWGMIHTSMNVRTLMSTRKDTTPACSHTTHPREVRSLKGTDVCIWRGSTRRKGLRLVSSSKGRRLVSTRKQRRLISRRNSRTLISTIFLLSTKVCTFNLNVTISRRNGFDKVDEGTHPQY